MANSVFLTNTKHIETELTIVSAERCKSQGRIEHTKNQGKNLFKAKEDDRFFCLAVTRAKTEVYDSKLFRMNTKTRRHPKLKTYFT